MLTIMIDSWAADAKLRVVTALTVDVAGLAADVDALEHAAGQLRVDAAAARARWAQRSGDLRALLDQC